MFFVISKILSVLLTPFLWILILFVLALLVRNKKWSRRFLIYGVVAFLFFSNTFIVDELTHLWEYPLTEDSKLKESYDVGIILGGGMVTIDTDYDRMTFRNNTDRMLQALRLYKEGRIKKFLFSSGAGSLVYRDMLESALLKRYMKIIEIPDSVILVDSVSDNTHENAVNTAEILKKNHLHDNCLLITSSMHMRRAVGCFKKENIEVTPYSVCLITGKRKWDIGHLLIPNIEAITRWDQLIHEVAGYVIYAINGYL
ncbi:MAG TPA: YdcF family protein [Bacteroidales bacterium]|nr:YdcF family protein [Bacteroidales bacterium]HPS17389.1 YdcF family protein [Bacteroidales bacterium]